MLHPTSQRPLCPVLTAESCSATKGSDMERMVTGDVLKIKCAIFGDLKKKLIRLQHSYTPELASELLLPAHTNLARSFTFFELANFRTWMPTLNKKLAASWAGRSRPASLEIRQCKMAATTHPSSTYIPVYKYEALLSTPASSWAQAHRVLLKLIPAVIDFQDKFIGSSSQGHTKTSNHSHLQTTLQTI